MFIFYIVYTKHQVLLICNENKEICVANLRIKQRFYPLKNKYLGVFVLNGLSEAWELLYDILLSNPVHGEPLNAVGVIVDNRLLVAPVMIDGNDTVANNIWQVNPVATAVKIYGNCKVKVLCHDAVFVCCILRIKLPDIVSVWNDQERIFIWKRGVENFFF